MERPTLHQRVGTLDVFGEKGQRSHAVMVWICTEERIVNFLPDMKSRETPKRRFMDPERRDVKLVGMREEDAQDRVKGPASKISHDL